VILHYTTTGNINLEILVQVPETSLASCLGV